MVDEDTLYQEDMEELNKIYLELKEKAARQESLRKNQEMLI